MWNGSACVNPCEGDPCTAESANSTGECTVISAEEYKCSCNEDEGFYWTAAEHKCVNPCAADPNPCTLVENSTGECTPASATEYECGCNEDLAWYAPLKECVMTAM